jgi:hypothetical protein
MYESLKEMPQAEFQCVIEATPAKAVFFNEVIANCSIVERKGSLKHRRC